MDNNKETFHIEFNRWLIKVERASNNGQNTFHVHFENELPDITITKATDASGNLSWSAVPAEMQLEAEQIGKLIKDYYRQNPSQEGIQL